MFKEFKSSKLKVFLFLVIILIVTIAVLFVINNQNLDNKNKASTAICGNGVCETDEVCEWDNSVQNVRICNNGALDHNWAMKTGDNCIPSCRVVRTVDGQEVDVSFEYSSVFTSSSSSMTSDFNSTEVVQATQNPFSMQVRYYGNQSNIQANRFDGVLEIQVLNFACSVLNQNCEPEKIEINYPRYVDKIFGLGRQSKFDKSSVNLLPATRFDNGFSGNVEEYYDPNFGTGTTSTPAELEVIRESFQADFPVFDGDSGRMRTPMIVLPKENTIIAYIQEGLKSVRITRSENRTQLVFSKKPGDPSEGHGKFVIIKGNNLVDTYTKYKNYLSRSGFEFKTPLYETFGNHWETRTEFTMKYPVDGGATVEALNYAKQKYEEVGVRLSSITFGSGFWSVNDNFVDWGGLGYVPTIDKLQSKDSAIAQFFNSLNSQGIKSMIGMRMMVSENEQGTQNVSSKLQSINTQITDPYLAEKFLYGPFVVRNDILSYNRAINLNSYTIGSAYVQALRDAYGPFSGIKEDEMIVTNQSAIKKAIAESGNIPLDQIQVSSFHDGYAQKMYKFFGSDSLIIGSANWFGVGNDAQLAAGWDGYDNEFYQDSNPAFGYKLQESQMLSQVISGYPHSSDPTSTKVQYFNNDVECNKVMSIQEYGNCKIPDTQMNSSFLNRIKDKALSPFFLQSEGFWHINDSTTEGKRYKDAYIYYVQLRDRLNQYLYDNALKWVDDGTSHLMRPLFFDNSNDTNAYDLYEPYTNNDFTKPKNEWMFGDALLVRPVYRKGETSVKVYLPKGNWKKFFQQNPQGPIAGNSYDTYNLNTTNSLIDYPIYLKEGQLLPIRNGKLDQMSVYVFLDNLNESTIYKITEKDGHTFRMYAYKDGDNVMLAKLSSDGGIEQTKLMSDDSFGKGFKTVDITNWITYQPTLNTNYLIDGSGNKITKANGSILNDKINNSGGDGISVVVAENQEVDILKNVVDGSNVNVITKSSASSEGTQTNSSQSVQSQTTSANSASSNQQTTSSLSETSVNSTTSSIRSTSTTSERSYTTASNNTLNNIENVVSETSVVNTKSQSSTNTTTNSSIGALLNCKYDLNQDGKLDIFNDYSEFLKQYNTKLANISKTADFNGDEFVDVFDFLLFKEALYYYFDYKLCK